MPIPCLAPARRLPVLGVVLSLVIGPPVRAEEPDTGTTAGTDGAGSVGFSYAQPGKPPDAGEGDGAADGGEGGEASGGTPGDVTGGETAVGSGEGVVRFEDLASMAKFGEAGQFHLRVGGTVANDFDDAVDSNVFAEYSQFLVDDLEIGVQLGVWYHSQPGDNAAGINPNMILRWHFLNRDTWTLYVMAGIGVLFTTDEVPDGGTLINFTPQAGGGFTYLLDEKSGIRLDMGLRWHHISNARIRGDDENPSRDAAAFYAGVVIPM